MNNMNSHSITFNILPYPVAPFKFPKSLPHILKQGPVVLQNEWLFLSALLFGQLVWRVWWLGNRNKCLSHCLRRWDTRLDLTFKRFSFLLCRNSFYRDLFVFKFQTLFYLKSRRFQLFFFWERNSICVSYYFFEYPISNCKLLLGFFIITPT